MKIKTIALSFVAVVSLNATTITELFDALEKQPLLQIDELNKQMGQIGKKKVDSNYYPTLNLFGSYTHYNSPTNLLPLDPITAGKLAQTPGKSVPFAQTIQKVGVLVNMPLYVKELGELSQKMKHLAKSAKYKKMLNLYKSQATILGANSGLEYLDNLLVTLNSTKKSVQNTQNDIKISVDNGRMPGIALDKIDQKLNELDININNINIQRLNLIAKIQKLTNIKLKHSVKMNLDTKLQENSIFALKPLEEKLLASKKDLSAVKSKRYSPKVALNVMYSENYAQEDVKLGKSVHEGYGYYQIGISIPLYDKSKNVDIELKKIQLLKDQKNIEKTKDELKADIQSIKEQLKLLDRSALLTKENIKKQKNLLKFAKVAVKEGRMTQEDYLRYEDGLLSANAKYYQVVSKKWQSIAKLTVIYGNNLKGMIK